MTTDTKPGGGAAARARLGDLAKARLAKTVSQLVGDELRAMDARLLDLKAGVDSLQKSIASLQPHAARVHSSVVPLRLVTPTAPAEEPLRKSATVTIAMPNGETATREITSDAALYLLERMGIRG